MLRCAIVEDTAQELEHLQNGLKRYSAERALPLNVTAFGNAADFLEHYCADYDIVFMDIELPGLNGMEAAHRLREIDRQVILIFVTNMAQYAVKGYEVDALDYIIKPAQYGPLSIMVGLYVPLCKQFFSPAVYNVLITVINGGVQMVIYFPIYKIIFPEGEAK